MKVLQTVKYYKPSKGGMESVVENIVEGINSLSPEIAFTIYANNHIASYKKSITEVNQNNSIKELTPFFIKSQPLNFRYSSLRKLIYNADVVHHHYPFPNMEMALLRNRDILEKKKLIITWHANIKNSRWSWIGKYYNPIVKNLLDIAWKIVVTSPQLLEASDVLQDYKEKVIVIPLSFDPEFSMDDSAPKLFPENRRFRILFVGKLRSYKGVQYLIEAIENLDVELTIVGEGEMEEELQAKVVKLSLQDRVSFKKDISNKELIGIYRSSDIFILPSINEAEAFGIVQLEAMSSGLPVINTKLESGVPYVSLHNVSGLTVEPGNSVELANAIYQIIDNKELYQKFSLGAIKRSKQFTRKQMADSYNNLYKNNE